MLIGVKQMRKLKFLLVFSVLCVFSTACGIISFGTPDKPKDLTILTIGTADSGGTMYPVGSAIAEIMMAYDNDFKINVSGSNGSSMNAGLLVTGEFDLGLVSGDVAYAAYNGLGEFDVPLDSLRAIGAIYSSTSTWVTLSQTDISFVNEIGAGKIAVGPQGSTTELSARTVLSALSKKKEDVAIYNCSYSEAAKLLEKAEVLAMHSFAGVPTPAIMGISSAVPCTILRYTEEELNTILVQNPYYYKTQLPANTYQGQTQTVDTFGVKCLLCVDASMDDSLVYALTQALWQSRSALAQQQPTTNVMLEDGFSYTQLPIPLHDAANEFYQTLEGNVP